MAGFKECFLVPKHLYNKTVVQKSGLAMIHNKPSTPPVDVVLKKMDFNKTYPIVPKEDSVAASYPVVQNEQQRRNEQINFILSHIKHPSKQNLASQILNFINTSTAGTVDWTHDYELLIEGQNVANLDIRDAIAYFVGQEEDRKGVAEPLAHFLISLGAPPRLFMFYKTNSQQYDDASSRDSDYDPPKDPSLPHSPTKGLTTSWEHMQPPSKKKKKKKKKKASRMSPGGGDLEDSDPEISFNFKQLDSDSNKKRKKRSKRRQKTPVAPSHSMQTRVKSQNWDSLK